jgi:hypothetical protein
VEQGYARVMAGLPDRGYGATEFSGLSECRLSETLAMVTGNCAWLNKSGDVMDRFTIAYTFRRTGDGWRIVVGAIGAVAS